MTLLRVRDLRTGFATDDGHVRAVDGVSFRVDRGKTFALVGESGCGKSVTAFSILRLINPPGRIESGRVEFEGANLPDLRESQMRQIRGGRISMVFQEPMSSLNPVYTCGWQISEAIRLHDKVSGADARHRAIEMLAEVGIPDPSLRYDEYPHQLSGGMRQRVMIAMALSSHAKLLIADEPTTALDVTIQAQILDLLRKLQDRQNLSLLLITHDLAVVAETAHCVGVMYASKMAELADAGELFARPLHPYTQGLFRSLPRLGQKRHRLDTIPGTVPNPLNFPVGCKFHPRCDLTRKAAEGLEESRTAVIRCDGEDVRICRRCREQEPELREVNKGHWAACWECPGYTAATASDPSAPQEAGK
jgi:oligopeptide/dipeptide ABC transporter ATP-binding protein